MIRRHEAWRTTFQVVEGRPVQVVNPPYDPILEVIDLRRVTAEQREAEALRLGRERARISFDMERGPLLRATLVQLGDEEFRLYLFLHHIIFDGFSMYNVFLPELVTVYNSLLAGQPSPLPELRLQYSDFAHWQRGSLDEAQLKRIARLLVEPTGRRDPGARVAHGPSPAGAAEFSRGDASLRVSEESVRRPAPAGQPRTR